MKKFLAMVALMVATLTASAQEYDWAVGVRGGGFSGLTAKKNNGSNALEFGLSFGGGYINVDGVFLLQQPVINEDFHLYYGGGAYVNLISNYVGVGVEGVVGLEYKIPNVPLAVSLDYRPAFNIVGYTGFNFNNVGLGVKYCF